MNDREPTTLAHLIFTVMQEDEVTLEAVAKRAGIPVATVGAWKTGSRGAFRPPTPEMLRKLAKGLRRPEATVFEAAGRAMPVEPENAKERRHMQMYRDLTPREQKIADEHMRLLLRSRGE